MIYLYGKGKRFQIVKDLLRQNKINDKTVAIDKKSNFSKKIYNEKYFLEKYNYKNDFLIITIANPDQKFKIFNRLSKIKKIKLFYPLISKSATIKKGAIIRDGTIIMDQAYIGEKVKIHKNCAVGVSSLISHDTTIKSFTEVSHKSKVAGNVKIGKKCFLGMGCIVIQNLKISDECFVGAGVLIKKNLKKKSRITLIQKLNK